jgi:hypothetical protein
MALIVAKRNGNGRGGGGELKFGSRSIAIDHQDQVRRRLPRRSAELLSLVFPGHCPQAHPATTDAMANRAG